MTVASPTDSARIKAAIFAGLHQIAPEAAPELLAPDVNIREALDIDSFDYLNFMIALDAELGVEIPEADYGLLGTLNDLVKYLEARV